MSWIVIGWVRGRTIELDSEVPEVDGKRVLVMLRPVDEPAPETAESNPTDMSSSEPDRES